MVQRGAVVVVDASLVRVVCIDRRKSVFTSQQICVNMFEYGEARGIHRQSELLERRPCKISSALLLTVS